MKLEKLTVKDGGIWAKKSINCVHLKVVMSGADSRTINEDKIKNLFRARSLTGIKRFTYQLIGRELKRPKSLTQQFGEE